MNTKIIAIAGGSGCGKSVLAYALKDHYPQTVEVVHFDDYQKEEKDTPLLEGMHNWDHPDAIDFEKLHKNLSALKRGEEVEVMTKSRVLNPDYEEKGRAKHVLKPENVIIVEGYLTLQNRKINELFDLKIYLDIPIEESMKRRDKVTYHDESVYNKKILIPMHKKYVAPTKALANISIDVVKNDKDAVYKIIHDKLTEFDILPT